MGFRVNHLWFKLEKKAFLCTTVLHHWGIQASFDKPLQESQWILHYSAELHEHQLYFSNILAIKVVRF